MFADVGDAFGLGRIDQISFAVEDLRACLPAYEALFGPFTLRRVRFTPDRVTYRGRPASATLLLGFGRSGDLEIELVQVEEGDAPSLEHLRRHGPGIHHVRFPVASLDGIRARMEAAGFVTVLLGSGDRSAFAYLESPESLGHTLFELVERHQGAGGS